MKNNRSAYYFALAAAASATIPVAKSALAVCGCTFADIVPHSVVRSQGPNDFQYLGAATSGYVVELDVDNRYGFQTNTASSLWVDYSPQSGSGNTIAYYSACRHSYDGAVIICGATGSNTTTGTQSNIEKSVSLTGLYSAANSDWDRYKLRLWSSSQPFFPGIAVGAWESWETLDAEAVLVS